MAPRQIQFKSKASTVGGAVIRRILIAPGPFKECLGAGEVANAIARGVRLAEPSATVCLLPMCDGGSGFVRRITGHAHGAIVRASARNPLGRGITAEYGVITKDGQRTAVIESAQTAGLALLDRGERDPRITTTIGISDLIRHAVRESNCSRIIVGCGDSATNDGGTGLLAGLGVRFIAKDGTELPPGGAALAHLDRIDLSGFGRAIRQIEFRVACNVTSILCGPEGTSVIYGPQKGASADTAQSLDAALTNYAEVVERATGHDIRYIPGGGAAGGLGAAIYWALDGSLQFSMNVVREFVALDQAVRECDLVITGEGSIDRRTATGKVVACVALTAKKFGKPVVALCGSAAPGSHASLFLGLDNLFPIVDGPLSLEEAISNAAPLIEMAAFRAVRSIHQSEQV